MHPITPIFSNRIYLFYFLFISLIIANSSSAQQISGGGSHSIALCTDGSVKAFGSNSNYQLGDTNNIIWENNIPIVVNGLSNVIAVSAGSMHNLALKSDGTVWAWGDNTYGQLGKGDLINTFTPTKVTGLGNIIAISAGANFSLALKNDGTVWAWGDNWSGQLGDGTNQNSSTIPAMVSALTGLNGVIAISAGDNHSIAIRNDHSVWAWGANSSGQLGNGTFTDASFPIQVPGLANVKAVDGGGDHSLALLTNGIIWAWGNNSYGQLGNGTTQNDSVPSMVQLLSNVIAISAGGDHNLALKNDSTVWMWGFDMNPPSRISSLTVMNGYVVPIKVNGLSGITKISCGHTQDLVYKNNGTFWSWGENNYGQLGNGAYQNAPFIPQQVVCPCGSAVTPTGSAGPDITICPNVNVIVNATAGGLAPFLYQWSPNFNFFSTRTDTISPSIYQPNAGTYTCSVIVSDRNLCSSVADSMVVKVRNAPPPPYIFANPTATVCNGNAITLTAAGGAVPPKYMWFPGGSTTTAIVVSPTLNTTYTLVTTDSLGCKSEQTSLVSILAPNVDAHNISCTQSGYALANVTDGLSPYTYLWSTGETTSGIYNLTVGNYTLTVTDANGCSGAEVFHIINPGTLTLAPLVKTNVTCNGACNGKIYATVSGGTQPYYFNWSNNSYGDTAFYLCPGGYTVIVTDAGGCSAVVTDSAKIIEPSALALSILSVKNVSCYGGNTGSVIDSISGGTPPYHFLWSQSGNTTQNATGLTAGVYTVTVTDNNNCSASIQDVIVTEPSPLSLSVSVANHVACHGGNTGSANMNAAGGTSPYSYLWIPSSQTTSSVSNLSANNYQAKLTDNNGCNISQPIVITQPSAIAANLSAVNISCNGMNDGSIYSNPTGGTLPYVYLWSSGGSSSSISNLHTGTYSLSITDANNCISNSSTSITQPTVLTLSVTATNLSCNGVCSGTATALPTGGTSPYTYVWSNGQITQTASGLCSGTYSVVVIDSHACSATNTISISQPLPIPITATATATACGVKSGTATATISGPGAFSPFHILWNTGDTNLSINNLAAGIYRANVTDGHGCFSFADALVSNSNGPTLTTNTITNISCNGLSNGAININVTGGSTPYTYHWSNGATTQDISNVSYGPYEIIVSDAGGCTATQNIFVNQPAKLSLSSSVINSSCKVANGSAIISTVGGTSPYNYLWSSGGTTSAVTGIGAGVYISRVTDTKGCKDSLLIAVSDSGGPVALVDTIVAANCGGSGYVLIVPQDSASISSYHWSNGAITQNLLNVTPGNYGLVITDTSGCKRTLVIPVSPVLPPIKPLCVVTVDTSTNKNMIVWEKPFSTSIAGFKIYRESSQNGIFQFIKYSPYSSQSTLYDSIANPNNRWSKYRISMVDICGKEGPLSPEHKTIHLSIQSATANRTNLIWDAYEGYSFSTYHIFRKKKLHGAWTLIDSVPAYQTTYADTAFPHTGDTIFYHIDVTAPNNCVATLKYPTPNATTVKGGKSNSSDRISPNATGVEENSSESWLKIYPNPSQGTFTVSSAKEQISFVRIYNMFGELLFEKNVNSNSSELTVPKITSGIYELRVDTKNGIVNKKIVISR